MKSFIVPTDFSPAAYNTARYAITLATDLKATKIVLYNAYQPYISEDPAMGTVLQQNMLEYKQMTEENLVRMRDILQSEIPSSIHLLCESDYNTITNGIENISKQYDADLVIMGVNGAGSSIEEAIIGSNAVAVSRHSKVPVIIVPAEAKYQGLKKITLALDFKKIAETTPADEIKKLLEATKAQLDILHVETDNDDTAKGINDEKKILSALFSNYNPQYHFIKGENFTDAINSFAVENNSDLIIVIPKKHGFFESIFKRSHTKALAFHSNIPVMSIHE